MNGGEDQNDEHDNANDETGGRSVPARVSPDRSKASSISTLTSTDQQPVAEYSQGGAASNSSLPSSRSLAGGDGGRRGSASAGSGRTSQCSCAVGGAIVAT
jgi:hypothetical protein